MTNKILILYPHTVKINEILHNINSVNDNLNICPTFTTDIIVSGLFKYHLNDYDFELSVKNHVLFTLSSEETNNNKVTYYGKTDNDIYSNEIVVMDVKEFNTIDSDKKLSELLNSSIIIFIDDNEKHSKEDVRESGFIFELLNDKNHKYVYLLNESSDMIANIINTLYTAKESDNFELINEIYEEYN